MKEYPNDGRVLDSIQNLRHKPNNQLLFTRNDAGGSQYGNKKDSLRFDEMDPSYEMKLRGKINIYNTASTDILSTLMVEWTT